MESQALGLDLLDCTWSQRLVLWLSFKVIGFSLYSYVLAEFYAFFLIFLLFNLFMCDSLNHPVVINSVKSVLQNVHFIIQAWNLFCNPFISLLNCFQSPLGSWPAKNREISHCFHERCYITTQQGHCSLFTFILVTLTDLLCIASTVAFLILFTAVVTFFRREQIGVK